MNLYDLTKDAQEKVSTYRDPDISEWIEKIDPILDAAGLDQIGSSRIDDIVLIHNEIVIDIVYSVRSCVQCATIHVPISIIKSDDPLKAAKLFKIKSDTADKKRLIKEYKQMLQLCEDELKALEIAKNDLM